MITKKDIQKLSELSRIEITESDAETLAGDLEAILRYVSTLKEADVSRLREISHLPYVVEIPREDEAMKKNKDESVKLAAELVHAAPEKENGYVKVKSILEKES